MYLRFVQLKILPEHVDAARTNYDVNVIPVLQNVKGCLYASLVQSTHYPEEYISMTLWDNRQSAEQYEKSGVFKKLWDTGKPFLYASSEWKITLSEDFTVSYEPVDEDEPTVTAYEISSPERPPELAPGSFGSLYVRIVAPQIRHGMVDEFRRIYETEIKPEMQKVGGCRYVALTSSMKDPDQVISLTIWNSQEDADAYERSGVFTSLIKKVEHTFSEMHQWKMQLEKETHGRIMTSEELTVDGFSILTGKSFL